jgi:large-conductance mechanosensitive channel
MAIKNILLKFGIFCDHLIQFVLISYIFPVLVSRTKKNLATLFQRPVQMSGYGTLDLEPML